MLNIDYLLNNIEAIDHRTTHNKHKHKIYLSGDMLCSTHIFMLLEHIKFIEINNIKNINISVIINTRAFSDEAVLIMLEIITYYIMKNNIGDLTYTFIVSNKYLGYEMFKNNMLFSYNTKRINSTAYVSAFEKKCIISSNHYRRIATNNEENRNGPYLSILIGDISTFLKYYNVDKNYVNDLSEAIVEIVDNALNHSTSDCLLDIKVLDYRPSSYMCLNVTVISIGDILINTEINKYIESTDKSKYSEKNEIILTALQNHKKHFSSNYDIESFATVSAFQKYVTTRYKSKNSGGTGLTTLIKQLHEKASSDYCYVLSGNNIIKFVEGYLDLTETGLIGFNKSNDYINSIPSPEIVCKIEKKFNGVIYNLCFILDEKENNNE